MSRIRLSAALAEANSGATAPQISICALFASGASACTNPVYNFSSAGNIAALTAIPRPSSFSRLGNTQKSQLFRTLLPANSTSNVA